MLPDPDRASRSAVTLPVRRPAVGRWAWPALGWWLLRVATAAALGIDAAVHWQNAPADDSVTATLSQGDLFRVEAAAAVAAGLLVLLRPRPSSWLAAFIRPCITGSAANTLMVARRDTVSSAKPSATASIRAGRVVWAAARSMIAATPSYTGSQIDCSRSNCDGKW